MKRDDDFHKRLARVRRKPEPEDVEESTGYEIPEDWEPPRAAGFVALTASRRDRDEPESWVSGAEIPF